MFSSLSKLSMLCVAAIMTGLLPSHVMASQRIKDLVTVQGVRSNQLVGYGLVVGLDGSGDQTTQTPFTVQSIATMLVQLGVQLPANTTTQPQLKNVAAVSVTATLPAFARPGQRIDITVSSIGNAKSLRGGTLLMSPLRGFDGQIYAMAQGNLLVGGAGGSAGGSSTTVNHLDVGRIPEGATVERAVPTTLGSRDFIQLALGDTDFGTVNRVVDAINRSMGSDTARALDGRVVEVRAPNDANERVQFLGRVENIAVDPAEISPKVIINARTGSVVMNQAVTLENCAVAHGNLNVTISAKNGVSQPNALSQGQTAATQNASVSVTADQGRLVNVPRGAKLADVVKALNLIGATPQDLLSILQAMKVAGSLKAELEII